MSNRTHRIAHHIVLAFVLATAGIAHAFAQTPVSPVRIPPLNQGGPSGLPKLKICFTKLSISPTESRTFARVCTAVESPGTVRLG